jgi:ABC-2 type transport system ATP-binding protein
MSDTVIEVEDLHKTYRDGLFSRRKINALQGVSFEVPRGEIFGLLGPNGAGKTTLIKVLLGIVRRSSGKARVLGAQAGSRTMRKRIGYLPENHRIPRHLTGNTAMEYYGCLSGMSLSEVKARRPALLEMVGLDEWGRTSVRKYSKGMQQRLGLAQSMLHQPDLIVLDEPTDGVDPVGRKEIREVLKQLSADGATVFLNSHLLQEVELVCDRVVILDKGRVLKIADVDELTKSGSLVQLRLVGDAGRITSAFHSCEIPDVSLQDENDQVIVSVPVAEQSQLDRIVDALRSNDISIHTIDRKRGSLEDAFIDIIEEPGQP